MNELIVIIIVAILCWCAAYTVSYGIWTFRENKKGGIGLFVLAAISFLLPLYILWIKR